MGAQEFAEIDAEAVKRGSRDCDPASFRADAPQFDGGLIDNAFLKSWINRQPKVTRRKIRTLPDSEVHRIDPRDDRLTSIPAGRNAQIGVEKLA